MICETHSIDVIHRPVSETDNNEMMNDDEPSKIPITLKKIHKVIAFDAIRQQQNWTEYLWSTSTEFWVIWYFVKILQTLSHIKNFYTKPELCKRWSFSPIHFEVSTSRWSFVLVYSLNFGKYKILVILIITHMIIQERWLSWYLRTNLNLTLWIDLLAKCYGKSVFSIKGCFSYTSMKCLIYEVTVCAIVVNDRLPFASNSCSVPSQWHTTHIWNSKSLSIWLKQVFFYTERIFLLIYMRILIQYACAYKNCKLKP